MCLYIKSQKILENFYKKMSYIKKMIQKILCTFFIYLPSFIMGSIFADVDFIIEKTGKHSKQSYYFLLKILPFNQCCLCSDSLGLNSFIATFYLLVFLDFVIEKYATLPFTFLHNLMNPCPTYMTTMTTCSCLRKQHTCASFQSLFFMAHSFRHAS